MLRFSGVSKALGRMMVGQAPAVPSNKSDEIRGRWRSAAAANAARARLTQADIAAMAAAADPRGGWEADEDGDIFADAEGVPAVYENSEDDDDYEDRFTKRAGYVPMYVPMYTGARVLPKRGGHTTGARRVRGRSRTRR
eukprot:jgi/Mesvir1/22989/Mv05683-RA.1